MKSKTLRFTSALPYCLLLLYTLAALLVSLHRFWQYDVFYYDFGIFDQAIWSVSRLRPPTIEHLVVGGKWIFADHFSPTIFLLSPLYWLTDRPEMLLVVQALAVGASGFILYRIGGKVLKNDMLSGAVMVAYLLFVGLQNAIITDFHEVTVGTLPLILLFWAYAARRPRLFWLFLILTLGIKESTSILGVTLGLTIALTDRKWRRVGAMALVVSLLWGMVATRWIIPFFAGGPYGYNPILPTDLWGHVTGFFNEAIKRKTLLYSFGSFLFLPILYPPAWLLVFQDLYIRFVPKDTNLRWDLGLHYSAQLAPILGYATVMSLSWLRKNTLTSPFVSIIAIALVINALFLHQFKLHGPLGLSYNPAFYAHTKNFTFLDTLVSQVPRDVTVMAQNNLATRFTHQRVFLLRRNYWTDNPDYIVIDAREGQNPNNFFGIKDFRGTSDIEALTEQITLDPAYKIVYRTEKQFVFKRI